MYTFVLILHIIVALGLIAVILVQRGRSGGLVEALGGIESIFGTKTSSFFVKTTVVLAVMFFMTSIGLSYMARARGASVMERYGTDAGTDQGTSTVPQNANQGQAEEPPQN